MPEEILEKDTGADVLEEEGNEETAAAEEEPSEAVEEEVPEAEEEAPAEEQEAPAEETAEEGEEGEEEAAEAAPEVETPDQMEASLSELYRQYPQLKDFLKKNPELRPAFFKAVEYDRLFGTVEDARIARDWALDYYQLYQYWTGGPEGKRNLLEVLWYNNLDENGNSLGHYEQLAQIVVGDFLTNLERGLQNPQLVQQWLSLTGLEKPEQLGVALEVIRRMGGLAGQAAASAGQQAAPAAGDPLAAREAALRQREQMLLEREQSSFVNSVRSSFGSWLSSQVGRYVEKAFASDQLLAGRTGLRPLIEEVIQRKTLEQIAADGLFTSRLNALVAQQGYSPETARTMTEALRARARQIMPKIAASVLRDLGLQLQQEAEKAKRLAQSGGRRREPLAGSPGRLTPAPARTQPQKPKPGETYREFAARILEEEV